MAQLGDMTLKVETDFSSDAIQLLQVVLAAQKERIALLEKQLEREREQWQAALQEQIEQNVVLQREALGR